MVTELTHVEKKLRILERMQRDIASKLDKSYLQNNVSDLLALEVKYETIMNQISNLRSRLRKNNRISTIT